MFDDGGLTANGFENEATEGIATILQDRGYTDQQIQSAVESIGEQSFYNRHLGPAADALEDRILEDARRLGRQV